MVRTVAGNMPVPLDLAIYQGDSFPVRITVYNPDGTPADLTGMTPSAQIRRRPDDPDVLAEFITQITGSDIDLLLPAAVTAGLSGGAAWDVQIRDTAGAVSTLAFGAVSITPEVTRDAT